ncbi:MAG: hypothetical protein RLY31_2284 [Bacteroidota bacterium]|jgi:hypothetical protein
MAPHDVRTPASEKQERDRKCRRASGPVRLDDNCLTDNEERHFPLIRSSNSAVPE